MDKKLVTIYLNDHLAGATGAVNRLAQMTSSYTDLSVHPQLVAVAVQVREDVQSLREVLDRVGAPRRRSLQVLGRAGELAGRLKLNGRVRSRSPLTPVVEVEALRSGVLAKLSLWQTLLPWSAELGVDREQLEDLQDRARTQLQLLEECHRAVRVTAFRGS